MIHRYITLDEDIRANGDRHLSNAIGHAASGSDHCIGSLRKARKNYAIAEMYARYRRDAAARSVRRVFADTHPA